MVWGCRISLPRAITGIRSTAVGRGVEPATINQILGSDGAGEMPLLKNAKGNILVPGGGVYFLAIRFSP